MNPLNIPITAIKKYQLICAALCLGTVSVLIINGIITGIALTKINTIKQQTQTESASRQAVRDQSEFFGSQTDIITAINQALPSQNELVNLVKKIESLEAVGQTAFTFGFSSLVPMQESNQYYLPFNLRLNATLGETIDFLRRFEKLPYLAKVNSITAKTPHGLSGILEVTITGRVYVQDNFKN
ncbi:hypothetical protein A3B57_02785 [Microgenomates group bacterium RIFCSPLOWO2_01_FULL_47_10]|nr:MAG: hypothetical protein A3B57_02785 [Microgenomates group bacterium RIFCSPLOWO2_01_FULL_47_10]